LFAASLLNAENQRCYDDFARAMASRHRNVLRPIPAGTAHLTHLFSADAPAEALTWLADVIHRAAAETRAFDIELGAPRVLLVGPRPRLVCADVLEGAAPLVAFGNGLVSAVQRARLPFPVIGSRSPHVTLVRFSKHATKSDARRVTQSLEEVVTGTRRRDRIAAVQLLVSTLTPAGPVYEVKARFGMA